MGEPDDLTGREPVSCGLVRVVPDVADVPVSPSSVVTEMCEVPPCCSDWEFVEPQFFSPKKRALCCTDKQDEMRYEGSPVKALPFSRRRMTSPAPLQNSYASFEGEQGSYEEEGRGWNARERTIISRTTKFLERGYSVKARVVELQDLLGPQETKEGAKILRPSARMF